MVALHATKYAAVTSRAGKSAIVSAIIDQVKSLSPNGGGFIKKDETSCQWYEVGDLMAREKVGQTMRDALHASYRSSTKAKKERRVTEQVSADELMANIVSTHLGIASKVQNLQKAASSLTSDNRDMELGNVLTQANLDILNELNRLKEEPSVAALPKDESQGCCTAIDNEEFIASSFQW